MKRDYAPPTVRDYGDIRTLTRSNTYCQRTDVPLGTEGDIDDLTSGTTGGSC